MSDVKHPENYYTYRFLRQSSDAIAAEIAGIGYSTEVTSSLWMFFRSDSDARIDLLEIERHLTLAHEHFFARKYAEALKDYKTTQALIYQHLDPDFPGVIGQLDDVIFPSDWGLFEPLLSASLELIDLIAPQAAEVPVTAVLDFPIGLLGNLVIYTDLGVNISEAIPRFSRTHTEIALKYVYRGQWKKAATFYRPILRYLKGIPGSEVMAARAALNLNLGAIQAQLGEDAEAEHYFQTALKEFTEVEDKVGEAQANHNLGTLHTKMGNHDVAKSYFETASALTKELQVLPDTDINTISTPDSTLNVEPASPSSHSCRIVRLHRPITRCLSDVKGLGNAMAVSVIYRQPGRCGGRYDQVIEPPSGAAARSFDKSVGLLVGENVLQFNWKAGDQPPLDTFTEKVYEPRVTAKTLPEVTLWCWLPTDFAAYLPHLYFYVIPVAIGDCYHELGEYQKALDYYLKAANYKYINPTIEVPNLWLKLAENILAWGDWLYRNDEYEDALDVYRKVLEPPGTATVVWAESPLYKHSTLKLVGDKMESMLTNYETAGVGDMNPTLAAVVLEIRARLLQLDAGLDFLGIPADIVPIWSFDYLQNVARYFAQQAINAEREFINFWDRAESDALTRQQLQQAVELADAEQELAKRQREAAEAERTIYEGTVLGSGNNGKVKAGGIFQSATAQFITWGVQTEDTVQIGTGELGTNSIYSIHSVDSQKRLTLKTQPPVGSNLNWSVNRKLATTRRLNLEQNKADYKALSGRRIFYDAAIATLGSGSSVDWNTIEKHIRRLQEQGRTEGERGHLIGARTLALGRMTRNYELGSMNRQITEFKQSELMAQNQLEAACARVSATEQMEKVASLRKKAAEDNLSAFDTQFFTPDVWYQMGFFMWRISQSYLYMAIRAARLMQEAYNFENDLKRRFIKADYSTNTVKGMLAGDELLLDIDSFTYDLITTIRKKQMPAKHTISLAECYPFLFETQFRRTGKMEFETRIEDFDKAYLGTHGRRIRSIEVEVEGMLPPSGVKGTLTNGGISRYRTPNINKIKFRIQPRETLVLSEYRIKGDTMIFPADPRKLEVFEGAGVAGSWILEIPRSSNDLDFNSITDVRLAFYYHTCFDELLAAAVKAQLATFAGITFRSRTIPLRWAFPDAFFHFQDTGQLAFLLDPFYFPFNELNPKIRHLTMLVITEPDVDPSGWNIRLGVPAHPDTIVASPNPQGEVTVVGGHPWQPLEAGTAIGDYLIEIREGENPSLVEDGVLNLNKIRNIALILEYEYTPRL